MLGVGITEIFLDPLNLELEHIKSIDYHRELALENAQ